jgi:hypothetical protein
MMPNTSDIPEFKVEIVSAPTVKDMTVTQIDQNMFSINLNIVTVVRYPSITTLEKTSEQPQLQYSDGSVPQPGGEAAAFNDFTKQHGYPPQSREVLAEWVKLQQGGA